MKNFNNWALLKPKDIAKNLSMINHRLLRNIPLTELLNGQYNKLVENNNPSALNRFSDWFNRESNWVKTSIITTESVHECSDLIQTFISIISKCISIHNFSSAMSIYSALNTGAIQRLSSSWSLVPPKYAKLMNEFDRILSFKMNYASYREKLRNTQPPCIPIFSLLARDLTHMEEGAEKFIYDCEFTKINFERLTGIAQQLIQFRNYQFVEFDGDEKYSLALQTQIYEMKVFETDTLYAMADEFENRHSFEISSKKKKRHSLRDVRDSLSFMTNDKKSSISTSSVDVDLSSTTSELASTVFPKKDKRRRSKYETTGPLDLRSLAATYDGSSSSKEKTRVNSSTTTTDLTKRMRPRSQFVKPVTSPKEEEKSEPLPKELKEKRRKLSRSASSSDLSTSTPEHENDNN